MAKEENLKSWKKGESGNPKGKPKGSLNRSTIAKKWLQTKTKAKHPISGEMIEMTLEDQMVLSVVRKAIKNGDVNAYKAIADSGYGTAKETIDLNSDGVGINITDLMAAMRTKDETQ